MKTLENLMEDIKYNSSMKTFEILKELISYYSKLNDSLSDDEKRISNDIFMVAVEKLIEKYPYLFYPLCSKIDKKGASLFFENFKEKISNCYNSYIPTLQYFTDVIGDFIIELPEYIEYENFQVGTIKDLEALFLSLIISKPIGKINFTIVDTEAKMNLDFIYNKINPKIYNTAPIVKDEDLRNLIDRLNTHILKMKQQYGNYLEWCKKNSSIPTPLEFIIITDNSFNLEDGVYESCKSKILKLAKIGNESGIFFIFYTQNEVLTIPGFHRTLYKNKTNLGKYIHSKREIFGKSIYKVNYIEHGDYMSICSKDVNRYSFYSDEKYRNEVKRFYLKAMGLGYYMSDLMNDKLPCCIGSFNTENEVNTLKNTIEKYYARIKVDFTEVKDKINQSKHRLIRCESLFNNQYLLDACVEYINREADKEEETVIITQDFQNINDDYENNIATITVPVGKLNNTDMNFRMDMISHVHSFIIGQSGSGKSVFLHNIIGSAILKYAPEDLQLFLLDFKLGGVEFNRYRGIKHIKSLLVDNSDQQITLEILRELRERMVERGKRLRDCGVNNIVEYNKQNPNATMPQILVVVDECHEMFRVGSDIPRTVSNEISEIVTKIAKEGRSQGVHLILATQTLSGTEISNEILNNISDHYLLKCAPVDSERMVERSSEITSKLQTGQIYYHHVENQVQFQAYYTDKENAALLINLAKEKAKDHESNGEFYFNGSQLFKLDKTVLSQRKERAKYPVAYMGKNISINQNDLSITLRKDYSENILLFGLNDMEQVTRTTMNIFLSLILTAKCKGMDIQFKVFNCLSNEDSIYTEQLEMLEEEGYCEIIEGRKDRGKFLKKLADDISNETTENTIFLILGQDRFRELKMDMEISQEQSKPNNDDAFGFGGFSFSNEGTSSTSAKTFKQALEIILNKGPELGVHTIMQLDKPSNFLFCDYISPKMVYQKFKHLIMLKSDESASAQLHLNDNIRLETLSKDLERLRAYYYSEESDTYTLFTPYMELSNEEIMNLLKSE